jgi:hypothetical protein
MDVDCMKAGMFHVKEALSANVKQIETLCGIVDCGHH